VTVSIVLSDELQTDASSLQALKPILHALLISGTLPHLSIAGNRKIKAPGWRMIAAYVRKVRVVMALLAQVRG
jgi:hypothetical protein